ncbi:HalOD1 output domain-containing protein [Natrarchaeobius chitinivorans]|uniref:Halobacterial output domain-containing protein n=1 Tax=Natrarchaeobius chitinivorans TaxID=1679083 RepID=A0A3N6LXK8_NATCH|nr:HalOD1 output domain-containing protein [Natrarchaeobius chitinivorans]RQG95523.1 hypothetical protein EA473_08725 [Natrarchaeobius chitinivorans]
MDESESAYAFSKPSMRVLAAIADAEGVSPAALEPPLTDVVDTAALDRLFESTASDASTRRGRVSFRYRGYEITVDSDGTVDVA